MSVEGRMKRLPPLYLLLAAFRYFPDSGLIVHRRNSGSRGRIGEKAGTIGKGKWGSYVVVYLGKESFKAHRVAWAMWHGYDPFPLLVDHINGDTLDNRAANLRIADASENTWNSKPIRNATGLRGIQEKPYGFVARINHRNTRFHLGIFPTAEDASAAYEAAKDELHGEFNRKKT